MKEVILANPFPTVGYHGSKYFCDREAETKQLIRNMQNGNSTTLIAVRRIGKTGLIHHTFNELPEGWKGVYVDILATENLTEFLNTLTTSIIQAIPQKSSFGKRFWNFIQSLRPIISFDTLTGAPQATFNIMRKDIEPNIASVLQFLDNQEFKTVIAIDEFQQIENYPEQKTDAWLRGVIQQLKNVSFIFSGSQHHVMSHLFTSPSKPFFRSTQILKLDKIDKKVYADFIVASFNNHNKKIDHEQVIQLLDWCNTHTYYVQLLCNRVFSALKSASAEEIWRHQAQQLLEEQEVVFINYRNLLTKLQWQLLKAIATEGNVYAPTSKEFIAKHKLGSSATIIRSLNSLQKYELVYSDVDNAGNTFYSVYDVLFQKWCKERY